MAHQKKKKKPDTLGDTVVSHAGQTGASGGHSGLVTGDDWKVWLTTGGAEDDVYIPVWARRQGQRLEGCVAAAPTAMGRT